MRLLRETLRVFLASLLMAGAVADPSTAKTTDLQVQASDGITLYGTLHVPEGSGPFPVIVFTHGSGQSHRGLPGYVALGTRFVERGIAALVFDKRGVGKSEGTYVEAPDLAVPADDVIAWVDLLKSRPDIRPEKIGVFGWSQGGWVGPLAATRTSDLAFVISIVGPAVSPLEQNIYDKTNQFRARGRTDEEAQRFSEVIREVWTYIVTGENESGAQAAWDSVQDRDWFTQGYQGPPMMDRERLLQHPRMKYFVEHSSYDPQPTLEQLQVPLLCVFGTADTIVPLGVSVSALTAAAAKSGNDELQVKVFEGADHGMQVTIPDGSRQFAPGFWDYVLGWAVDHSR